MRLYVLTIAMLACLALQNSGASVATSDAPIDPHQTTAVLEDVSVHNGPMTESNETDAYSDEDDDDDDDGDDDDDDYDDDDDDEINEAHLDDGLQENDLAELRNLLNNFQQNSADDLEVNGLLSKVKKWVKKNAEKIKKTTDKVKKGVQIYKQIKDVFDALKG